MTTMNKNELASPFIFYTFGHLVFPVMQSEGGEVLRVWSALNILTA